MKNSKIRTVLMAIIKAFLITGAYAGALFYGGKMATFLYTEFVRRYENFFDSI